MIKKIAKSFLIILILLILIGTIFVLNKNRDLPPISITEEDVPVSPEKIKVYEELLNNERIKNAIESSTLLNKRRIFLFSDDDRLIYLINEKIHYSDFLVESISQLEKGNIGHWSEYEDFDYGKNEWNSPYLNLSTLREVSLRKAAFSLYLEANEKVPWSLLDYTDEELKIILGEYFTEPYHSEQIIFEEHMFFNTNPLRAYSYAQKLDLVEDNYTQKDFLFRVIEKMREEGWVHISNWKFPHGDNCDPPRLSVNFKCAEEKKKGTSTITPLYIYSVLQAHNIPSEDSYFANHGGIEFTSLGLYLDGDGVYRQGLAGIRIRPNFIPVEHSFWKLEEMAQFKNLPPCEQSYKSARYKLLKYFNHYKENRWNKDLVASYCFTDREFLRKGDFLRNYIKTRYRSWLCTEEYESGKVPISLLTEEEIRFWLEKIAGVADCETLSKNTSQT